MAMGDIEAAALAPLLVRLKGSLQHLGLSHNNFRAEGTAMLAGMFGTLDAEKLCLAIERERAKQYYFMTSITSNKCISFFTFTKLYLKALFY